VERPRRGYRKAKVGGPSRGQEKPGLEGPRRGYIKGDGEVQKVFVKSANIQSIH